MFAILLPDLPGFSVEQIERTEKGITITARAMSSSARCPDCQQASSRVHSYYTRCPMDLPSSGRPIWLLLHVRHFRCPNRACPRKTFAEPLLDLLPYAQRTSRLRENLRQLGEEGGGEAGARRSLKQAMTCSASTILRLLRHGPLPTPLPVKVLGVDEWAWRQSRAMERYSAISSVISRSISCKMPRRTLLQLGSKSILLWSLLAGTGARPKPSGQTGERLRRFRLPIASM